MQDWKPGPRSIAINQLSLVVLMDLRGLTQQALAEKIGVGAHRIHQWIYDGAHPTEDNFEKLCQALQVEPPLLMKPSRELRDLARHKTVMKHYFAELLNERDLITDYRTIQSIESDIERTAELESGADETRELEVTVASEEQPSGHPEPDPAVGDKD